MATDGRGHHFLADGAGAPPDSRSMATSHGGFDDDPDTMDSVARRILGRPDIARFPIGDLVEAGEEELVAGSDLEVGVGAYLLHRRADALGVRDRVLQHEQRTSSESYSRCSVTAAP